MKKKLLFFFSLIVTIFLHAQNVGIGTTNPQATLDVKGNQRLGGITRFTTFDSIGGKIEWRNANLYVPVSQYLMQHSAAADGLYYNNNAPTSGQLEYRNATGNPAFYTNFLNGNGYFKGRLGISTINPLAGLHVADSSVLFSALGDVPVTAGFTPISGAGRRMMWYPDKAAFRAGYVDDTQWNKDSIGQYSIATGYKTKALGFGSIALGNKSLAIGQNAIALGADNMASGVQSTAMGNFTTATGDYSTAMGYYTISGGDYSTAMGRNSTASGYTSTAMGNSTASGYLSTAMGFNTTASGLVSTVLGNYTKAKSGFSLVIGSYNDTTATNRLFEIGNGTADYARNNAMTVLNNGNVGIGTSSPQSLLHIGNSGQLRMYDASGTRYAQLFHSGGGDLHLSAHGGGASYINWFGGTGFHVGNGSFGYGPVYASAFTVSSSQLFKKNIVNTHYGLTEILQLQGKEYQYINDITNRKEIGLIAEEVELLLPEVVYHNPADKKVIGLDYGKLVPVLIESIKEQQKQIDSLSSHNKEQQKQIDELKKLVQTLIKQ
ncbi:MAG: tail fiber domain-containing protein [Ferruginibacter sp.]|nr:tail fiber domain-containing protein [Ferruginibacter sp.]